MALLKNPTRIRATVAGLLILTEFVPFGAVRALQLFGAARPTFILGYDILGKMGIITIMAAAFNAYTAYRDARLNLQPKLDLITAGLWLLTNVLAVINFTDTVKVKAPYGHASFGSFMPTMLPSIGFALYGAAFVLLVTLIRKHRQIPTG